MFKVTLETCLSVVGRREQHPSHRLVHVALDLTTSPLAEKKTWCELLKVPMAEFGVVVHGVNVVIFRLTTQ